ncbi:MAG: hypothetical protein JW682_00505 [Campylobacterales bacterium]|nr:hypothetical protein [Campylobacterales bacterium]
MISVESGKSSWLVPQKWYNKTDVTLIKKDQLKGISIDPITKEEVGIIETKEKGGKIGDVMVEIYVYEYLQDIIETEGALACNLTDHTVSAGPSHRTGFVPIRIMDTVTNRLSRV